LNYEGYFRECENPQQSCGLPSSLPGETLQGTFEHIDPSENVTELHDYSWHRPPDGDDSTPSQMIASGEGGCLAEIPVPGVHHTGVTLTVTNKSRGLYNLGGDAMYAKVVHGIGDYVGLFGNLASWVSLAQHNELYWFGAMGQFFTRGLRSVRGGCASSFARMGERIGVSGLKGIGAVGGIIGYAINLNEAYEMRKVGWSMAFDGLLLIGSLVNPCVALGVGIYYLVDYGTEMATGSSVENFIDNNLGSLTW
jgi:hypothetical protein